MSGLRLAFATLAALALFLLLPLTVRVLRHGAPSTTTATTHTTAPLATKSPASVTSSTTPAERQLLQPVAPQPVVARRTHGSEARIVARVTGCPAHLVPLVRVTVQSLARDDAPTWYGSEPDGTFRTAHLEPGEYRVAVAWRGDVNTFVLGDGAHDDQAERADATPALAVAAIDPATVVDIAVAAGAGDVQVVLQAMPLCRVSGRVLQRGRPVSDALVIARTAPDPQGPVGFEAGHPCTRSDAEGRFAFIAVAPGSFTLCARQQGAPVSSPAVEVAFAAPGEQRDVELQLGGTTVRGRIALANGEDARVLTAWLLRLEDAAGDPYYVADTTMPFFSLRCGVDVAAEGSFALPSVPPGRYVLHVGGFFGPTVVRMVDVPDAEVVDLGTIRATGTGIALGVQREGEPPANLPSERGAWLRRVEGEHRVWWATLWLDDSRLELPPLDAGRYELEPFAREPPHVGEIGCTGRSLGAVVRFQVGDDGALRAGAHSRRSAVARDHDPVNERAHGGRPYTPGHAPRRSR